MDQDVRGLTVEKYNVKPGVDNTLGKIRQVQKKIKQFQMVKDLLDKKMQEMGKTLTSQGQSLLGTLPSDPMRDLPGMNFNEENNGQDSNQQPSQDSMRMRY